jgi:hypothetical protein
MFSWFQDLRRRQIVAQPFPDEWLRFIETSLPHWQCLTASERQTLREHVQVFIAEKRWEAAGGVTLSDEIQVAIAAQACLLLLGLPNHQFYPNVQVVIVYPWAYWSREERRGDGGMVHTGISGRLGEAWPTGQVVLSWNSIQQSFRHPSNGHNVVLHEFAHLLDMRDGWADGVPLLAEGQEQYDQWADVMAPEYERLRQGVEEGEVDVLDGYGATNPAEFFAVATECFFEMPLELRATHPELYQVLSRYYRQDTAQRAEACRLLGTGGLSYR